jgi:hypothetical protein
MKKRKRGYYHNRKKSSDTKAGSRNTKKVTIPANRTYKSRQYNPKAFQREMTETRDEEEASNSNESVVSYLDATYKDVILEQLQAALLTTLERQGFNNGYNYPNFIRHGHPLTNTGDPSTDTNG